MGLDDLSLVQNRKHGLDVFPFEQKVEESAIESSCKLSETSELLKSEQLVLQQEVKECRLVIVSSK
jgi:hypothetical protein